nr:hypothetical protein [Terriglobales bacterium]
ALFLAKTGAALIGIQGNIEDLIAPELRAGRDAVLNPEHIAELQANPEAFRRGGVQSATKRERSIEPDPQKLLQLVEQINQILDRRAVAMLGPSKQ